MLVIVTERRKCLKQNWICQQVPQMRMEPILFLALLHNYDMLVYFWYIGESITIHVIGSCFSISRLPIFFKHFLHHKEEIRNYTITSVSVTIIKVKDQVLKTFSCMTMWLDAIPCGTSELCAKQLFPLEKS